MSKKEFINCHLQSYWIMFYHIKAIPCTILSVKTLRKRTQFFPPCSLLDCLFYVPLLTGVGKTKTEGHLRRKSMTEALSLGKWLLGPVISLNDTDGFMLKQKNSPPLAEPGVLLAKYPGNLQEMPDKAVSLWVCPTRVDYETERVLRLRISHVWMYRESMRKRNIRWNISGSGHGSPITM